MLYVGSKAFRIRSFAMILLNSPSGNVWPLWLTAEAVYAYKSWCMNGNKCMVIMKWADGARAPLYGIFSREAFSLSLWIKFTDDKKRKLRGKLSIPNECICNFCLDHLLDQWMWFIPRIAKFSPFRKLWFQSLFAEPSSNQILTGSSALFLVAFSKTPRHRNVLQICFHFLPTLTVICAARGWKMLFMTRREFFYGMLMSGRKARQ